MSNPVTVKLDIFDRVQDIKLSDRIKNSCEYTLETYFEYLDDLKNLVDKEGFSSDIQDAFLLRMKLADIRENHLIEEEDSLLIDIYNCLNGPNVTDELIKRNGEKFSVDDLKRYHRILLQGTSSDEGLSEYVRTNNEAFVGTYNIDGSKNIEYMPLDYNEITQALDLLTNFYNDNRIQNENDVLIKPFLFHALVACLQLFRDGNTRFGRVLQHAKIWNLTNQYNAQMNNGKIQLKMPALYLTKPYKLYRKQYRQIIASLVTNNHDEDWNNWLLFNLWRTDEALNKANNDLQHLHKIHKRSL